MGLYKSTFVNDPDEIYFVYTVPDDSYLLRLIADHSGHVKALTWRESDGQWKEYWKSPQFKCDYYGHCGAYSTCELATLTEFGCACLLGSSPSTHWNGLREMGPVVVSGSGYIRLRCAIMEKGL
jgi:hypothetical protein